MSYTMLTKFYRNKLINHDITLICATFSCRLLDVKKKSCMIIMEHLKLINKARIFLWISFAVNKLKEHYI